MNHTKYPILYQVNTRVWLTELSQALGRPASLDDIPGAELDRFAELGFQWIWFLSVWQTGLAGQKVSRTHRDWQHEFQETLTDLQESDIAGSGFAITDYRVASTIGGEAALARLRGRCRQRGLKVMLDFVPNHMGLDHPWVHQHPDFFIEGTERDLVNMPQNYTRVNVPGVDRIFAYGRDPYFSGWPDTLQLDYSNPRLQAAMIHELTKISQQCDGVRCDMAMLVLPDVFQRTWGRTAAPFWPTAIGRVHEAQPDFVFMAEVYWDLECEMQQQGFQYTYDKRLYDRLRGLQAEPVREHFRADIEYQNRLARFIENHDEPRAAVAFGDEVHQAAAVITFLSPGLRFFHHGQREGNKKRVSPHLVRKPVEPPNHTLEHFYSRLLSILRLPVVQDGQWRLLDCMPGWEGNWTHDCFFVFEWQVMNEAPVVVAVNYAPTQSQCHVRLSSPMLAGRKWLLLDLLSDATYEWNGDDLVARGLFLDLAPWQACVFQLQ